MAASEAARYAPHRPFAIALHELRAAWTREADLKAELAVLEPSAARLVDVVRITAERDRTLPALKDAYQRAHRAAEAASADLARIDADVTAHAADITAALRREWNDQRPSAARAAHLVTNGPGRFGQRLLAVRAASEELARWSTRWQPYLPDMPTRTEQVVRYAVGYDNPFRVREAFDQHARTAAEHARPDYAIARTHAQATTEQRDIASGKYSEARGRFGLQLYQYGSLAHLADPNAQLVETNEAIVEARHDLAAVRDRAGDLLSEPALRTLSPDAIAIQREAWTIDRDYQRRAAHHVLAPHRDAHARSVAFTPHPYEPREPEHSRGISR
jgi:hypothetical protein